MSLTHSQKEKVILLVQKAIPKVGDRPELKAELEDVVEKLQNDGGIHFKSSISSEDIEYVNELIQRLEEIVEEYVKTIDVNDIERLETSKKELTVNLMYLSTFKDKFLYEIEYLEDVFKKEIFSKLTSEISLKEGISYTQAEKKVNADERYMNLRKELSILKNTMSSIKTKYDFFIKMVQVIVQSISVAGKEHYSNRVSN